MLNEHIEPCGRMAERVLALIRCPLLWGRQSCGYRCGGWEGRLQPSVLMLEAGGEGRQHAGSRPYPAREPHP